MIEQGTIVVVIEGGNLQEVYCQGEEREYIVVDCDDDAIDRKWIREGTTDEHIPEEVEKDIEIERARQAEGAKYQYLMLHLRALSGTPPMVDGGTGWSACGYCGNLVSTPQKPTDLRLHADSCAWAKAKKALEDDPLL